jgi:choline-sulfatase
MRQRPNVVVIMTDQHRHDLMGCAGRSEVPTPNIDRIAKRGLRFTEAYCSSPICVASRMSMLSGLAAHTNGVKGNTDRLDWRYRTIAHHFAEQGYLTGLIGKMHFNDAHKHGFEYYLSINDWLCYLGPKQQQYANEIASHPLSPNFFDSMYDTGAGFPDIEDLWKGPSPWVGKVERHDFASMTSQLSEEDQLDAFLTRASVKFIQDNREQPFLLFASLMKPHTPLFAPAEYAARYPIDADLLPEIGPTDSYPKHLRDRIAGQTAAPERMRKAHRAGYRANLAYIDVCIGRILDSLEAAGLLDDTILVYTSDHGELDGDHGLYQKFCLFEPAVRVPMIVCDPRRAENGGKTSDALVEQLGLYPTLAELAGLPQPTSTSIVPWERAPRTMEGRSWAGQVRREGTGPDAAFSEFMGSSMIRTRRWKYVHNHGATHELYDLAEDPKEYANLVDAPEHRRTVEELRARLLAWHDPALPSGARQAQAKR